MFFKSYYKKWAYHLNDFTQTSFIAVPLDVDQTSHPSMCVFRGIFPLFCALLPCSHNLKMFNHATSTYWRVGPITMSLSLQWRVPTSWPRIGTCNPAMIAFIDIITVVGCQTMKNNYYQLSLYSIIQKKCWLSNFVILYPPSGLRVPEAWYWLVPTSCFTASQYSALDKQIYHDPLWMIKGNLLRPFYYDNTTQHAGG